MSFDNENSKLSEFKKSIRRRGKNDRNMKTFQEIITDDGTRQYNSFPLQYIKKFYL